MLKAKRALNVEHIDRRTVSVMEHEAECIKKLQRYRDEYFIKDEKAEKLRRAESF